MKTNELFSKNLIRLRKNKKLSQRELAEITGLSQRMITYYENNPNSIPVEKLEILSKALDVSISELFGYEKNNTHSDNLDVRWFKKIHEIKQLSESDQKEIIKHINSLVEKNQLKKEKSKKFAESHK